MERVLENPSPAPNCPLPQKIAQIPSSPNTCLTEDPRRFGQSSGTLEAFPASFIRSYDDSQGELDRGYGLVRRARLQLALHAICHSTW